MLADGVAWRSALGAGRTADSPDRAKSRYRAYRLVYSEATSSPLSAISREKAIKGWSRRKKIKVIEWMNPNWLDLSEAWGVVDALSD
ncbi:hypothetical protein BH23GEM7_BH23GEM7_03400 [soil metagenome]